MTRAAGDRPAPGGNGLALGVCGWSGSGKTTLLESVVPILRARGLRVVVVKHDAHTIQVDRPGKDSDRLFRAGADVVLQSAAEVLERRHAEGEPPLADLLGTLRRDYDVVLVEGHKTSPIPKVWLLSESEKTPPPDARDVIAVLARGDGRLDGFLRVLECVPRPN